MSTLDRKLLAIAELGKAVTSTLDRETIRETILERLSQLIRARNWTLFLLDREQGELSFALVAGMEGKQVEGLRLKLGQGLAGQAAATGKAILVPDASADPRFDPALDRKSGFTTRSLITLPLKLREEVIGVLQIVNPEDAGLFNADALPILELLADFVAIALNNAANHERIARLVVTDDVSGHFNSRFLHTKLRELLGQGRETALVFLDMDNFKRIVDTYGHPLGTKVLTQVSAVIASRLCPGDFLVRYGGDEFILILPGQSKKDALRKVEEVREALTGAVLLEEEGHHVKATASFGIAHYPTDAADLASLLKAADISMYRSKDRGKNAITVA